MSTATELILMAYKLLHKSMNHLTRSNIIKQEVIAMRDGSRLTYNIDITVQTEQEHSIAYQTVKNFSPSFADSIELELFDLLSNHDGQDPTDDGGITDLLTAEDPQCAQ